MFQEVMGPRKKKIRCRLSTIIIMIQSFIILCDSLSIDPSKEPPHPISYLNRFEPVFYNTTDLLSQHKRVKRESSTNNGVDNKIKLEFFSHGRNFQLDLGIDNNIFHPNVIIENSAGPIQYNTRKVLSGKINDDLESTAYGILTKDGVFDGYLSTRDGEEFYMEPKKTEKLSSSIMYRPDDVDWTSNKESPCASQSLYELHAKKDASLVNHNHNNSTSENFETKRRHHQRRRRKRWAIDPKKKTCMLYLQADHLFYERFGSEEACIDIMTKHIQRVNDIYRSTDFDNDGKPDDITFMIKRVKVHTANHTKEPSYRYQGEFQVIKFLEIFSEGDYDSFCLAYMFTFRDFEGGTLGLAWTGDLKNAGGVCEKKGHFRGGLKSLNTGIITLLNYGKVVPPSVSYVTLAHEIGHNFGSPHDPEVDKSCVPGGEDGNYIMFARATAGDKKNNGRFSPCSLRSILPVLNIKARDVAGCFTEPQESICGNGVVEKGEECDCGWEEDCKESCCFPMQLRPSQNEPPCRLRPTKHCSPSQGPCCTTDCTVKLGDKCRDDNGCRDASFCDGLQPFCPTSISKPNKTVCNKESVCFMGECTGSICLAYGLESCQCNTESWESSSKLCELCCKLPGEENPCLSSFQWNEQPYDVPAMFAKPGSPCKNYTGYCDAYQTCREIDPSGPLATLRKLLLADEGLAFIAEWVDNHWYAVLSFVALLIILMVTTAKVCGKRAKARLRKLTVMHSNIEAIQIQRTYLEDAGTVHPVAVRKKIPFKKKVRERRTKDRNRRRQQKERKPEAVTTTAMTTATKVPTKIGGSLWRKKQQQPNGVGKSKQSKRHQDRSEENDGRNGLKSGIVMPVRSSSSAVPTTTTVATVPVVDPQQQVQKVTPSTSTSSPQIMTHEARSAIVPHAKEQKRKRRKGPPPTEGKEQKKISSSSSKSKKSVLPPDGGVKKKSNSSQVAAGKKLGDASAKSPKTQQQTLFLRAPHSNKKNIQVLYTAPFSVKVQVNQVVTNNNSTSTTNDGSKQSKAPGEKKVKSSELGASSANGTKSKPSSSFLQRRQRNKKSKNPSQSELRVLISPNDHDDDLQSPVTPMT